ncbi:pyruvate dehydrogenase (acetyl-transferring) kinase, mitochondrial isoform X1 [Ischnura elegans]|uniref:pyruvate dehydrogenase (acetyl-transferring) kinase, mitochondrial isoform X1 n=1 Tax=Ischnura elegans TaxID=197161 RepID=UPI001ED8ADE6|nr:pyruvate dehydrogenase (acetyl-transferring) kinase, mitochondrial isoform X1 [Ischnura elegans]
MKITGTLRGMSKMIDFYSQFNPSPLSIKKFIDFGRNASERRSFVFLRKELPVRLANIMKEIHLLPENLLRMPSVALVNDWYMQSFSEILQFEKGNSEEDKTLERFCEMLVKIRNRHSNVVQTMAQGVLELKESHEVDQQTENSIQYFLDRFYMSRISIRMLINQHTLLFGSELNGHNRHIGCIDPHCDLSSVVRDAYENARFLCDQYYLASPELRLKEHNGVRDSTDPLLEAGVPIQTVYVPSHLYHMLFELFKNAMRAVLEHHASEDEDDIPSPDELPPLEVTVVRGREDISLKVSDLGGGIPRSEIDLLFNYMYSTAPQPSKSGSHTVPLAGYGYGLPISRLYARYFHGDLILTSCEGYGTDAVIYMKALSNEANELLPVFNKASSRHYRTTIPTGDWSNQNAGGLHGRQMSVPSTSGHGKRPLHQQPLASSNGSPKKKAPTQISSQVGI